MTKPGQPSISKRTRSKIKQTTLLDYKVSGRQQRRMSVSAVATTRDDASAVVAAPAASSDSNATEAESRLSSSSSSTPSCHDTTKRTTRTESIIDNVAATTDNNRRARNDRRRVANNAATTASVAPTAPETTTVAATVAVATTNSQLRDNPTNDDDDPATSISNKRARRDKRTKLCHVLLSATDNASMTGRRLTRQQLQQQQNTMETVTPSPDSVIENNALELSKSSTSTSSSVELVEKLEGTGCSREDDVGCSTPLNGTGQGTNTQTEENSTENSGAGESKLAPPPLLPQSSVVTVDRLEALQTRRRPSTMIDEFQSTPNCPNYPSQVSSALKPTFHQPWQQPYQPAISNKHCSGAATTTTTTTLSLPPGVIDIDAIPHACCLHSHHSHSGYSWISSQSRCGCAIDSNHNSSECITEAYLASYGVLRFGTVGLACVAVNDAGKKKGEKAVVNESDWKTEQWWLEQTRKGMEATASPITKSGHSLLRSTSSRGRASSILSQTVVRHVDYIQRHPKFTLDMRRTLMDWLLEVTEEYKLSSETFWLSVRLVDRSLACSYGGEKGSGSSNSATTSKCIIGEEMMVPTENIQLLGCACTLIASKLIEIIPPTADDFVYITDKTYTRNEVLEMEAKVCNALKFNFNYATPYKFVHRFLRASYVSSHCSTSASMLPDGNIMRCYGVIHNGMNSETNAMLKMLVFYLLDLAVLEYKLMKKKPSLVTAAAVYLARATLGIRESTLSSLASSSPLFDIPTENGSINSVHGNSPKSKSYWTKTLEYYTGYDVKDLEDSVRLLHRLQQNAENCHLVAIFNKHKSAKCNRVAMKTVLHEDDLGFR